MSDDRLGKAQPDPHNVVDLIRKPARQARLGYVPSPTMKRFHESKALFRGVRGPIGSGKTVGSDWELFRLACEQEPFNGLRKTRWAVVRATYPELVSTTIKTWRDWFPADLCPIKMGTPIEGHMRFQPQGDAHTVDMEIMFIAVEREEDTRKLLGGEFTGIMFNEARELPWGIIKDGIGRIGRYPSMREGGHTRKAAIADTNPPDDDHWWYRLAEEGRLSDDAQGIDLKDFEFFTQPSALIQTEHGYAPNPAAENVANMKDGYRYWLDQVPGRDPQWISVYLLGQYGTIQDGKPVYGAAYADSLHCSPVEFEPVKKWPLLVAYDFGRTPAVAFMQQTPRGQIRVIEEIVTEDSDAREVTRDMVRPRLLNRYEGCPVFITGDPAGDSKGQQEERSCYDVLREELKGMFVDCAPAFSNVFTVRTDAVRKELSRLSAGKAVFQISPSCKVLRKGFLGAYKFAKVRVAGGAERYMEQPVKNIYSHISEAVQYGVMWFTGGQMTQSLQSARATRSTPYKKADPKAGM